MQNAGDNNSCNDFGSWIKWAKIINPSIKSILRSSSTMITSFVYFFLDMALFLILFVEKIMPEPAVQLSREPYFHAVKVLINSILKILCLSNSGTTSFLFTEEEKVQCQDLLTDPISTTVHSECEVHPEIHLQCNQIFFSQCSRYF